MSEPPTHARYRKATWRLRASVSLTLLVLVGTTGCVVTPSPTDAGREADSPQHVEVPGVPSCRVLARMQAGSPAPPGTGIDSQSLACLTDGPAVDLSQLRGKPVLVNLWASWCGPCRDEMPILQAAHDRYGERIQFVGVATRDASSPAANFLRAMGVTYPQLADPDAKLLAQLGIPGLPVTLILGSDGSVVDKQIGAFDEDQLKDALEKVLAEAQQ